MMMGGEEGLMRASLGGDDPKHELYDAIQTKISYENIYESSCFMLPWF